MIVIDEATSRTLLTQAEACEAVAAAFVALHRGDATVFPVAKGFGAPEGSTFSMKSGSIASMGAVGLKVGSYWPGNSAKGIPSHGSNVLLLDPDTGAVRALIATSHLNALRTAAANALAVRHLARPDAATLGIVGAGHQAWYECLAVLAERSITQVRVWNRDPAKAQAFAARLTAEQGVAATAADLPDAAACDIVATVTASRDGLVDPAWLRPGAHVSAMGADGIGKRELLRPYPASARLFADRAEQSRSIGEFQGLDSPITELGAVIAGDAPGRQAPHEITLFDSSGLAIQDLAIATRVLERYHAA